MHVESVSLTGDRDENQDHALYWHHGHTTVAVVANGLGGHSGGALASRHFCEALRDTSSREQLDELLGSEEGDLAAHCGTWLDAAAARMRAAIAAEAPGLEPLTTCALALSGPTALVVAHIGDSRVYRVDGERMQWRTRDHSVVQMLVDDGELEESAMGTHPDQGKLFRAIGMAGALKPTVRRHEPLVPGEALIVCSDGFWERVQPTEMCALLRGEATLRELAELAVRRAWGQSDNVTAVLLRAADSRGWRKRVRGWLDDSL